ncbi:MAG TPA: FkbM family methyltransferase [Dehalococcoidia bacterium]|nr:FkbM family methyltransferase [Dehalococcoidia bacterium]
MNTLSKYGKNIKSQDGEDGILEYIFSVIGEGSKRCVEFGAWDGEYLSNTWNLVVNRGWEGVYIESDKKKYKSLFEKWRGGNKKVLTINKRIESTGNSTLDNILKSHDIPKQIDLLSIDVDGNEYYIWESIREYKARVIVIEHNPTIPPHIEAIGCKGNTNIGSSVLALCNLAKRKGHELICCTATNSIFVLGELFDLFNIEDNTPERLMQKEHFTYVLSTYDGRLILTRKPTYSRIAESPSLRKLKGFVFGLVKAMAIKNKKLVAYSADDLYEIIPFYCKRVKGKL